MWEKVIVFNIFPIDFQNSIYFWANITAKIKKKQKNRQTKDGTIAKKMLKFKFSQYYIFLIKFYTKTQIATYRVFLTCSEIHLKWNIFILPDVIILYKVGSLTIKNKYITLQPTQIPYFPATPWWCFNPFRDTPSRYCHRGDRGATILPRWCKTP